MKHNKVIACIMITIFRFIQRNGSNAFNAGCWSFSQFFVLKDEDKVFKRKHREKWMLFRMKSQYSIIEKTPNDVMVGTRIQILFTG